MNNQYILPVSRKLLFTPLCRVASLVLGGLLLALQGCGSLPESGRRPPPAVATPAPPTATAPPTASTTPAAGGTVWRPASWSELPGWPGTALEAPWRAFLASCVAMGREPRWSQVCGQAAQTEIGGLQAFFERWFTPHALRDELGNEAGLLTGYYEPLLHGSRTPSASTPYAVYGVPEDLLHIDLSSLYPELAHHRLRGRLQGRKVVPYSDRAAIEGAQAPLAGRELLWVSDAVALFFLHIQGSGKVLLPDGTRVRLTYADQNGHPYKAIGKVLIERGELRREEVSLQSIRAWLTAHPDQAAALMAENASYVFFQELPDSPQGPKGSQGVALTPGHSIAVDPRVTALGTPIYIASTWPQDAAPLHRLTVAQDTGGAIRGAVRADLFLGAGDDAEDRAGRMRQPLRAWALLPKNQAPAQ